MMIQTIEVKSVLASTGGTFHLELKLNDTTIDSWDHYVDSITYQDYVHENTLSVSMQAGDTITYRIYGGTSTTPVGGLAGANYVKLCGTDKGSISGNIEDTLGNPVSELYVAVYADACGSEIISGDYTDPNGDFSISELPEGSYFLRTVADLDDLYWIDRWYDGNQGTTDCNDAASILVTMGNDTPDVDITLKKDLKAMPWIPLLLLNE
jgi:hypothetical protein